MHDQQNMKKKITNIPEVASYFFLIQKYLENVLNFSTRHINCTILYSKNDEVR